MVSDEELSDIELYDDLEISLDVLKNLLEESIEELEEMHDVTVADMSVSKTTWGGDERLTTSARVENGDTEIEVSNKETVGTIDEEGGDNE